MYLGTSADRNTAQVPANCISSVCPDPRDGHEEDQDDDSDDPEDLDVSEEEDEARSRSS